MILPQPAKLFILMGLPALFAGQAFGAPSSGELSLIEKSVEKADSVSFGPTPLDSISEGNVGMFQIPAPRGQVTTRDGEPLINSKTAQRVMVRLTDLGDTFPEVKAQLAEIEATLDDGIKVRIPSDEKLQLHFKHRPWVPLAISRDLLDSEAKWVSQKNVPATELQTVYVRQYPKGSLFAHLGGYVGVGIPDQHGPIGADEHLWPTLVGRTGLEKAYDQDLEGTKGLLNTFYDGSGQLVNQEVASPPKPGLTLVTTLNLPMQELAAKILRNSGRPGAFVAVDADTGEILAMVSHPNYDPRDFVHGISQEKYDRLAKDPQAPFFDRALTGQYPPGSIFKPIVALAGMEKGTVWSGKTYDCPGGLEVAGRYFKNWHSGHEGDLGVEDALMRSSNTWFYRAGLEMGTPAIYEMASRFGLGEKPDLPLDSVKSGFLPTHKDPRSVANMSIGQGLVTASPLQMALAMAALVNGEFVPTPHLILQKQDPITGEVVYEREAKPQHNLYLEPEYLKMVQQGMYQVVNQSGGTAKTAALSVAPVYGKTGTAQWSENGKKKYLAWFTGWIETQNPRIAFAVMTQGKGSESLSGGRNAAPLAANFLRTAYENPKTYAVTRPEDEKDGPQVLIASANKEEPKPMATAPPKPKKTYTAPKKKTYAAATPKPASTARKTYTSSRVTVPSRSSSSKRTGFFSRLFGRRR
ncbi:MAG: penicillin-binding transpeptidase domain-containing protein [Verrucomicrobiota bacterium]